MKDKPRSIDTYFSVDHTGFVDLDIKLNRPVSTQVREFERGQLLVHHCRLRPTQGLHTRTFADLRRAAG